MKGRSEYRRGETDRSSSSSLASSRCCVQDRRCKAPLDRRFRAEESLVVIRSDHSTLLFFMQSLMVWFSAVLAQETAIVGGESEKNIDTPIR